MTDTKLRASALLLVSALLAGCVAGGGAPASSPRGETVNDPDFSGVTNTEALDDSYTPDTGL